ncbi:hypothetical protein [Sulfurimonas sp. HSL3-7]|uniref:hypothetical protein n=1 Tax=Sulfonitrofixus jiaomeiensis TaxID=3131938 RepID=UPI0031F941B1
MLKKIEEVIEARLNGLTPQMVKEMVQNLIREHLGWLVVWCGDRAGKLVRTLKKAQVCGMPALIRTVAHIMKKSRAAN